MAVEQARDTQSIEPDVVPLVADVCIIGAGPAGLTLAAGLLGSGLSVLVLESGSASPPRGGQPYEAERSVGLRYPLAASRARGVGGSACHWDVVAPERADPHVRLRELDRIDFADRPGVRSPGWPMSRDDLEPAYRRARALLDLPAATRDGGSAPAPLEHREFAFARASTFTTDLPARIAADPRSRVLADTVVTELRTSSASGPITDVSARHADGTRLSVRARVHVLAAGGIENARLLLASCGGSPAGLGNASGHVGRHFMEHVHCTSGLIVPVDRPLHTMREAWDLVLQDGHPVQRKYALTEEVRDREGLLDVSYYLTPRPPRWLVPLTRAGQRDGRGMTAVRHVRAMATTRRWRPGAVRDLAELSWAAPLMAAYALRQRRALRAAAAGRASSAPVVFTLGAMAEQQPCAQSAVHLGPALDRFGVPEAVLDWRVGGADLDSLRRSHDLLAPPLARSLGGRAVALLPPDELPGVGVGYHHMGTTRMSLRPQDGVVDADLRVHGVPNLFVAGSSVFPSGGSANPTLTVVALSLRLADLLRRELHGA